MKGIFDLIIYTLSFDAVKASDSQGVSQKIAPRNGNCDLVHAISCTHLALAEAMM